MTLRLTVKASELTTGLLETVKVERLDDEVVHGLTSFILGVEELSDHTDLLYVATQDSTEHQFAFYGLNRKGEDHTQTVNEISFKIHHKWQLRNLQAVLKPRLNHNTPIRIVSAAVKIDWVEDSLVIASPRHFDTVTRAVLKQLPENHPARLGGSNQTQGFVDQFGYFWCRKEALKIALSNRQFDVKHKHTSYCELYSEDLY